MDAEVIVEQGALEGIVEEWDELAVSCGEPCSAPAWMLAWWRNLRPAGAALRVVAVRDGDGLVGLAPFYVTSGGRLGRHEYRLIGNAGRGIENEFAAIERPLAAPGREWDVAGAIGAVLADADPRPTAVAVECFPLTFPWPAALGEQWPGWAPAAVRRYAIRPNPTARLLEPTFDDWLASRSSKFAREMRRRTRRFTDDGGTMRLATPDTIDRDLEDLVRLHAGRFEGRPSRLVPLGDRLRGFLSDLVGSAPADGRVRLRMMEVGGRPICAELCMAAGGEVLGVAMGWDDAYRHISPLRLSILATIEDAYQRGDRRVQLGWGLHGYKRSFADAIEPVGWALVFPPRPSMPLTMARSLPLRHASAGGRVRARLRGLVGRAQ